MGYTVTEKIISEHLREGEMIRGSEIGIRIDQTLTQDATGTMAYLEFEAMGIPRIKTELSIAYIDHNTLQNGFENADDHRFIRSAAAKYGLYYSRPGNGICHQVHLERFGVPGKTLLGSDSHTPTGGGLGMLAMGAGGLDVAVAMGGGTYYITMPKIINVELRGKLQPMVGAKDIILKVLEILSVKGGVGSVIEYSGAGLASLSVPERATITNMGAELGATSSVFPSDEVTLAFLKAQRREEVWRELKADADAVYDRHIVIELDELQPLAACPHSPDNIRSISELAGMPVDQICIGSCTNSSLADMLKAAAILKGRTVAPTVDLSISPGSRQVLAMLSECGALEDILQSGARLLECACGPCIGMGFSPNSRGVSLRTFNRNFEGRSGTADAQVYLVSPETAAASAVMGCVTDPRTLEHAEIMPLPEFFRINDNGVIPPLPAEAAAEAPLLKGPNIKSIPIGEPLPREITAQAVLKVGDNITTDHIMPAGAKILPFRSNIPHLSQFCFGGVDADFHKRAKQQGKGFIIGGVNYGQGSSREHAALVPLYLGVKAVIVKSFARIHMANLINAGILPLSFRNAEDYDLIEEGDELQLCDLPEALASGSFRLKNLGKGIEIELCGSFSERQKQILLQGGLLNYTKGANE